MPKLEQSVIIVTGASAGIGEATVRRLVAAGARVAMTARRAERLSQLCAEIDPTGRQTVAVPGDVTDPADRRALVEAACAKFGRIDGLVNNAGFGQRGPIECVPLDAIRRNFETNVFSLVALTQLVAPLMRAQGSGRIVNVGSVAGRIARPLTAVYDSTKHALEGLNDGLRGELAPFGVRVILVRPGAICSDFNAQAEKVSSEALAGAEPYAKYLANFRSTSSRVKSLAGTPDDVAKVIVRALSASSPRTHYAVPGHATFFLALKWLMPAWVMDRFVALRG